jgi:hypothetical protein
MARWILLPLGLSGAALLAVAGLFLGVEHRVTRHAPDYRVVRVGGLEYEAMLGRPVRPAKAVDAKIVAGLPTRDRRLPRGQILFGAFIAVTNDSPRALPTADRIVLRDERGHVYHPLRLPGANPYAYAPRLLHPSTRIPRFGTRADDNLAATGRMLLFQVPGWQYRNGRFELVIHDPGHPASTASLIV